MDNSEALTVERVGHLYPTARLASLKRILSDQRFINAHNHHVHYDGYEEEPAELRRFKWELYNLHCNAQIRAHWVETKPFEIDNPRHHYQIA